jgi:hypothetical protein
LIDDPAPPIPPLRRDLLSAYFGRWRHQLCDRIIDMTNYETQARALGWKTSDSGAYLMCEIALDALQGSVSAYNDGHAFIDRCDGDWEYACEVSGAFGKRDH